jgi:4-cresol dehydrogenase (hydroxylating)
MMKKGLKEITCRDKKTIEKYQNNITAFSKKKIDSIVTPNSLEELESTVIDARKKNMHLYITSTGKNWGLGSKQPITDNDIIVHLKNMNQIIEINQRFRYAIIEPGVTQKQLSDFLLKNFPNLKFPVTGSAEETSIIGNILERGVAAFGHRNQMIVAMEVLLANGELLRTGFWHYFEKNNPLAFHYPYGHGPDLRGLFIQSNLGIVTKMVIRLQPRTEGLLLALKFKEQHLKIITDLIKKQQEEKILDSGILITNQNDPRTTKNKEYQYQGEWFSCIPFSGQKNLLKCKKKLLRKAFANLPIETFFISTSSSNHFGFDRGTFLPFLLNLIQKNTFLRDKLNNIRINSGQTFGELSKGFEALKGYYNGIPSNYSIETMAMMNNTNLQSDDIDNTNMLGISLALPAVPIDGEAVLEVTRIVNDISKKWSVTPFHNFSSVDELTFEGFYRIYFDRNNSLEVNNAHKWSNEIHVTLRKKNYLPYRIDNKQMENFTSESDVFWKTIKKIKLALDEDNIISRKKYSLI